MITIIKELEWFETQFGEDKENKLFDIVSNFTEEERRYMLTILYAKKHLKIRDFLIKKGLKPLT